MARLRSRHLMRFSKNLLTAWSIAAASKTQCPPSHLADQGGRPVGLERVRGIRSFDEFDVRELHGEPGLLLRVPYSGELHDRVRMAVSDSGWHRSWFAVAPDSYCVRLELAAHPKLRKCGQKFVAVDIGFPFTNCFFCGIIDFEYDVLSRAFAVVVGTWFKHDPCISDR